MPANLDGDATLSKEKFKVRINRRLKENSAIDTLIHEIAHCIAWHETIGHGVAWGKAYSKAYTMYLDWLESYEP